MKVVELRIVLDDDQDIESLMDYVAIQTLGVCELESDGFGRLVASAKSMTESIINPVDGKANHDVRLCLSTGRGSRDRS